MISAISNNEVGSSVRTKINSSFTLLNAGRIFSGSGAPVADPGTTTALYIDEDNGAFYVWIGAAWIFKG